MGKKKTYLNYFCMDYYIYVYIPVYMSFLCEEL